MLFALVVMAGILLLTMVFNNRRQPSRWERRGAGDGQAWAPGGEMGDSGSDCGGDAGSCDGGGGGGD